MENLNLEIQSGQNLLSEIEKFDPETREVVDLANQLIAIPSVSVPPQKANFEAICAAHDRAREYAESQGLRIIEMPADETHPYPFLMVTFQENELGSPEFKNPVALMGHLDVVPPSEEGQFTPRVEGDRLYGRASTDMKTVAATYLVWMGHKQREAGRKPPFLLMLSSCEENASERPHHTMGALKWLKREHDTTIRFALVGERTGELEWMDNPKVGPICKENRGWRWGRGENRKLEGKKALEEISDVVQFLRTEVVRLNGRVAKREDQKGVKTGFVNPFVKIVSPIERESTRIVLTNEKGESAHAALTDPSQKTVVENFQAFVEEARHRFGENAVYVTDVEIGEVDNFNTYNGSGKMQIAIIRDVSDNEVTIWTTTMAGFKNLKIKSADIIANSSEDSTERYATFGIDIREVSEHYGPVRNLITHVNKELEEWNSFKMVNNRPAWRCPSTNQDLEKLGKAYETVVGEPSPNYVKLHGNDGGSLAELQQGENAEYARKGLADAVVFGQVGKNPHGKGEFHDLKSIRVYWDILNEWAKAYQESQAAA